MRISLPTTLGDVLNIIKKWQISITDAISKKVDLVSPKVNRSSVLSVSGGVTASSGYFIERVSNNVGHASIVKLFIDVNLSITSTGKIMVTFNKLNSRYDGVLFPGGLIDPSGAKSNIVARYDKEGFLEIDIPSTFANGTYLFHFTILAING